MVKLTAVIEKEQDTQLYVAWCPEVDVASQGESMETALDNLKEALELYFEDEDAAHSDEVGNQIEELSRRKDNQF